MGIASITTDFIANPNRGRVYTFCGFYQLTLLLIARMSFTELHNPAHIAPLNIFSYSKLIWIPR